MKLLDNSNGYVPPMLFKPYEKLEAQLNILRSAIKTFVVSLTSELRKHYGKTVTSWRKVHEKK